MKPIHKLIALSMFAVILLQCSKADKEDAHKPVSEPGRSDTLRLLKNDFESQGLRFEKIREVSFGERIRTNGLIDVPPSGRAVISALIGGYVKETPLLVGDKVNRGQRLVSIENIAFVELQQEFLEASEKLNYLKSEYERQKQLYEEKISSRCEK